MLLLMAGDLVQVRLIAKGGVSMVRGATMHRPKYAKKFTFNHKIGRNWVFVEGLKGEVQKVHCFGPKGHFFGFKRSTFGGPAPPQN